MYSWLSVLSEAENEPARTLIIRVKVNSLIRVGVFDPLDGGPIPNCPFMLEPIENISPALVRIIVCSSPHATSYTLSGILEMK